ncbi:hypothetical protein RKD47_002877 [Streptomyces albogriseolus]
MKSPLPDVEETRWRLKSGQVLIGRLTVSEWLDRWLDGKRIRKSGLSRYETDIRVHLKPRIGHHRLDRLRVSHLSEMFTAIADANAEILEHNAQRRAAVEELATVPWKGTDNRARRKVMKTAIDAMPPFRRVTGPATYQGRAAGRAETTRSASRSSPSTRRPTSNSTLCASRRLWCGRTRGSPSGSRQARSPRL